MLRSEDFGVWDGESVSIDDMQLGQELVRTRKYRGEEGYVNCDSACRTLATSTTGLSMDEGALVEDGSVHSDT